MKIGSGFRYLLVAMALVFATAGAFAQQTSTVRAYTLTFNGVTYDWGNNTSTWNYTLQWNKSEYKYALSHLSIALCAGTASAVSPDPWVQMLQPDHTTGITGMKWDTEGGIPDGVPVHFSFTLDGAYAVASGVEWSPKAATDADHGKIDGPACFIAQPDLTVTKSCVPAAFVGDTIEWEITVANSGNVPLNVNVDDDLVNLHESIAALAPGGSQQYRVPFAASAAGQVTNTVSASGDYYGNQVGPKSASCTTSVYALSVAKTASTSYRRNYNWSLTKSVAPNQAPVEIGTGETKSVAFVVGASRVAVDSDWSASGTIVVSNPAPIEAKVIVSDDLGGLAVPVNCGAPMPVSVPAGGSISCSYSVPLQDGRSRTNLGVATLLNGTSFSATAPVEFGEPSQVTDGTIEVTETPGCPDGFVCSVDAPSFSFSAPGEVVVNMALTNGSAMCQTYYTPTNSVSATESEGAHSATASFTDGVVTPRCAVGCTLTIGFWKTHAGFTGRNEDVVSQYLPQFLGAQGGAKSRAIDTPSKAVTALSMGYGSSSNGITKLYAQLMAAKLNVLNGASSSDVASVLSGSDAFLASHDDTSWSSLAKGDKAQVISWMSLLDSYNNGIIGPGHCN